MKKVASLSLIILLVVGLVSVGYAKDKKYPLKATIKSDRKVYEVGEPIKVEFRLENTGLEPIIVLREFIPITLEFEILDEQGKNKGESGMYTIGWGIGKNDFIEIKPQSFYSQRFILTHAFKSKTEDGEEISFLYWKHFAEFYYYFDSPHADSPFPLEVARNQEVLPGKYRITAHYKNDCQYYKEGRFIHRKVRVNAWTGELTSNTITITVKPAKN